MASTIQKIDVLILQKFKGDREAYKKAIYARRIDPSQNNMIVKLASDVIDELFEEYIAEQKSQGVEVVITEGHYSANS